MISTNYRQRCLLAFGTAFICLLGTQNVQAQATRTWVSGVGDDANPCSRTAPCKTFAGAISKTAAAGEINIIDPGGYGGVTITKSITINGGGSYASILVSGTNGIIVNLPSTNDVVTIRNISINGVGAGLNGIRMISGGSLFVENVQIQQFTQNGINFEPNNIAKLFVSNTEIRNTGGGVLIKPMGGVSVTANLDDVLVQKNTFGVRAEDGSIVTIKNSTAAGNLNCGFLAVSWSQPVEVTIENSSAVSQRNGSSNSSGVRADGAQARIRISNSIVINNDVGLNLAGGSIASWGNNKVSGNTINGAPNSTLTLQ
jgi:hypothetical protein